MKVNESMRHGQVVLMVYHDREMILYDTCMRFIRALI